MQQITTNYSARLEYIQVFSIVLFISLLAKLNINIEPVPVTMQNVAIIFVSLFFSFRVCLIAVTSYILLGLAGVPVFTSWQWFSYKMFSPSFGYICGFIFASIAICLIKQDIKRLNFFSIFLLSALGNFIIFAFGILHLSIILDFNSAIEYGLMPFILPEIFKIFFLASLIKLYQK